MKKKAQVGKILASLPVLILVIIIMGLFITLSVLITGIHKPKFKPAASVMNIPPDNLLTQMLKANIVDPSKPSTWEWGLIKKGRTEQNILVVDAFKLYLNGEIKKQDLSLALNELAKKEKKCYLLYYTTGREGIFSKAFRNQGPTCLNTGPKDVTLGCATEGLDQKNIVTTPFIIQGEDNEIIHYFGRCP